MKASDGNWTWKDFVNTPIVFLLAMQNRGLIPDVEHELSPTFHSVDELRKWQAERNAEAG